jgi:hypothetical protein
VDLIIGDVLEDKSIFHLTAYQTRKQLSPSSKNYCDPAAIAASAVPAAYTQEVLEVQRHQYLVLHFHIHQP